MQLSYEKRVILQVTIIGMTILTIGAAVIYPTVKYIYTMNRETVDLRMYLEKRYETTLHLRQSRLKAEEIKERAISYPDRLFQQEDRLKLITSLEELATTFKVVQKINNLEEDTKTNQLKISLETSGDYKNTLDYLTGLEKMNYFLNINQLNLTPVFGKDAQATSSSVKMEIEASLYVNN